jgi:hypothetical protein
MIKTDPWDQRHIALGDGLLFLVMVGPDPTIS